MKGRSEKIRGTNVYCSIPDSRDAKGAVLLVHEWWGLNDAVKQQVDGFAAMGYKAAALDLFNGKTATDADTAGKIMGEDKPEVSLPKLKNVLEWMRSPEGLGAAKVVTMGFCFGGGYSLQCALKHGDKVDGSVIYYGQLVTDPQALKGCHVPLLGIFAKEGCLDHSDDGPPVQGCLQKGWRRAGVP